jgi:hypothetical protein
MTIAYGWRVTICAPTALFMLGADRNGFNRLLSERLGGV